MEEFKLRFKKDTKYKELSKLTSIHSGLLMGGCRLSICQLDPRGNRFYEWAVGEMRGGEPYESPEGWIGIGIKVFGKYFDDRWLDMQNLPGEWVVAYHGVGTGLTADEISGILGAIIGMGFKAGRRQAHKDCEDQFHPGQKVGEGVYCTPSIKVVEVYTWVSKIRGKNIKHLLWQGLILKQGDIVIYAKIQEIIIIGLLTEHPMKSDLIGIYIKDVKFLYKLF